MHVGYTDMLIHAYIFSFSFLNIDKVSEFIEREKKRNIYICTT